MRERLRTREPGSAADHPALAAEMREVVPQRAWQVVLPGQQEHLPRPDFVCPDDHPVVLLLRVCSDCFQELAGHLRGAIEWRHE